MFERKPLRQQVQKEILARLADDRLAAETRINESHLAADLGISRTPLREAMLGLEATGGSYKALASLWNIVPGDYKKLHDFLRHNDCLVDYRPFRRGKAVGRIQGKARRPSRSGPEVALRP